MMKYIVTLFFLCSFHLGQSQSVFSLEDSLIILEKTIAFENVHWYGEIVNIPDTAEVAMKWKLRTPNGVPSNWLTNFDPGTAELLYVVEGDSARFTLFKEVSFLQKLVIGVKNNGEIGTARYEFDIFPVNNPSDLQTQVYEVTFTDITAVEEATYPEELFYLSDEGLMINEELRNLSVHSIDGRRLYSSPQIYPGLLNHKINEKVFVVSFEYGGKRYGRRFIGGGE